MFKTLALAATATLALASAVQADDFSPEIATAIAATLTDEGHAYTLGQVTCLTDLCAHLYIMDDDYVTISQSITFHSEEFVAATTAELADSYYDGFYETVGSYREIVAHYNGDRGVAKQATCMVLANQYPEVALAARIGG